jgi:thiol:disulfide interchange protein DsbD
MQSEGRAGKTLGLALFYVLGLALVYSALGVFAAMTGQLFGSLMQSPFVLGGVALVLLALALSMAGLFTIQPPQALMARSGAKAGAAGALAMGALLGVVAAPCVGPAVAALLVYVGTKGDPLRGFLLFFLLSVGLGTPYLLLGTFSGSIKSLPRSGPWLERLKKLFAVPLVIAALYYGYLTFNAVRPGSAAPASAVQSAQAATGRWPAVTAALISEATAKHKAVVLDFRADWCEPCKQLEHRVFSKPEIHQAAGDKVLLLQVDRTT